MREGPWLLEYDFELEECDDQTTFKSLFGTGFGGKYDEAFFESVMHNAMCIKDF